MPPSPAPNSRPTVGLVGVGLIGLALAERLTAAGYRLVGFDPAADRLEQLCRLGGTAAASAAAVFAGPDRVVLSLPDGTIARQVVVEALPALRAGQLVIDTTTCAEVEALELGDLIRSRGAFPLEATISGNSAQVRAGAVTVFAGGAPEAADAGRDLLGTFARKVLHVGPIGAAAQMKLVTNLVLGLNRAALAEGLALAQALGMNPDLTLEALRESPANSRAIELKGPKMISGDFTPEARLAQHLKDVRLILETARRSGARVPLSLTHLELLEEAVDLGLGALDNSAIVRVLRPGTNRPT